MRVSNLMTLLTTAAFTIGSSSAAPGKKIQFAYMGAGFCQGTNLKHFSHCGQTILNKSRRQCEADCAATMGCIAYDYTDEAAGKACYLSFAATGISCPTDFQDESDPDGEGVGPIVSTGNSATSVCYAKVRFDYVGTGFCQGTNLKHYPHCGQTKLNKSRKQCQTDCADLPACIAYDYTDGAEGKACFLSFSETGITCPADFQDKSDPEGGGVGPVVPTGDSGAVCHAKATLTSSVPVVADCGNISCSSGTICHTTRRGKSSCVLEAPEWWKRVKRNFNGFKLARCRSLLDVAPAHNSRCHRARRTCFFGTKRCSNAVGSNPTKRCYCKRNVWKCRDVACPTSVYNGVD